jgi:hypothetical protein
VRSTFAEKAGTRFTGPTSSTDIAAASADATLDTTKDAFFLPDRFWVQKAAMPGILPVSSPVLVSSDDDDTTVPITITADDMTSGNADLSDANSAVMNLTVLASVIDLPVSLDDTTQYRAQTFGTGAAPATGPAPSPTDDGSPPPPPTDPPVTPDTLGVLAQQYVAAGGTQADFDAFVADMKLPAAAPYEFADGVGEDPDPDDQSMPAPLAEDASV